MNNRNEENFTNALKTLVRYEPEKLAFFDELEKSGSIPPFIPERRQVSNTKRRRLYSFSMAAAAACCALFIGVAAYGFVPGILDRDHSGPDAGGNTEVAVPAPGYVSQEAVNKDTDKDLITPEPDDIIERGTESEPSGVEETGGVYVEITGPGFGSGDDGDGLDEDESLTQRTGGDVLAAYTFETNRPAPFIPLAIAIIAAAMFVYFLIKRKHLGR